MANIMADGNPLNNDKKPSFLISDNVNFKNSMWSSIYSRNSFVFDL